MVFRTIGIRVVLGIFVLSFLMLNSGGVGQETVKAAHGHSGLEFSVKIQSVNATGGCIDDWLFGCGNADFYPVVSIDAGLNQDYSYKDDDNSITPNWQFPKAGTGNKPKMMQNKADFKIEIWDRDGGLRGDDDHIDINPGSSRDLIGHIEWQFDEANPNNSFTWARLVVDGAGPGGTDFVTNFADDPPFGFRIDDIEFAGNSGDRARVTLDFSLVASGGISMEEPGAKVRPLGIHSPIHPGPLDSLVITAGLVDEFGDAVSYDTIEIWIDEDGQQSTTDDRHHLIGSVGGSCWVSGATSGSTCSETVDLALIPEAPGLSPDEQRMFAYGIYATDVTTHIGWVWSGWRSLTVGNRAGENFIGFSIGTGNPRNAVDLLYSPNATDYGAVGCSMQAVDPASLSPSFYDWNGDGIIDYVPSIPTCASPVVQSQFTAGVEDNWKNSFFTSTDWSFFNWCFWVLPSGNNTIDNCALNPAGAGVGAINYDTPQHLDVVAEFQEQFNFWYTTEPGIGTGFTDGSCGVSIPKEVKDGIVRSIAPFVDTTYLLHTTPWRDCAPGGGKRVTITQSAYPTTLHETGHRPFGAADIYCCDGGYFQRSTHPNLYAEQEDFFLWLPWQDNLEGASDYSWGDTVPGCEDEDLLGTSGKPIPDANNDPCPSFTDDHFLENDWFRPEPVGSLMGNQWTVITLPDGRRVFTQAGPSTYYRVIWYLGVCDGGGC
jgi:hypothetical protein